MRWRGRDPAKHAWCATFAACLGVFGCGQPTPSDSGAEQAESQRRSPQLFDLGQDLGERNDIAATEPMRVERMMAALDAWKEEVGALEP